MHFTSSLLIALAGSVSFVSAAPAVARNAHRKRAASDIVVFKFADVLEQLESQFYAEALAKFKESDFIDAKFSSTQLPIEQFLSIQGDEKTHSVVLQAALRSFGEEPITNCKFKFDSVLTDVATMAATARVVENVGVAAYLGAAVLLTDPVLLTSAGSILTVEARHQTVLNILSGTGTAIPAAFDLSLTPSEILAIAGGFLDGPCELGVPANPPLAITNTGSVGSGTKLTFSAATINGTVPESQLFCQMMLGGMTNSITLPFNECVVPEGINGPVGIWITSDNNPLVNNVRDRATDKLIAGPTMAFIDNKAQTIGALVRGAGSVAVTSTSTSTISPEAASSIIDAGAPKATSSAAPASSSSVPSSPNSSSAGSSASSGPGPNLKTGPSQDGSILVQGWVGV